VLSLNEYRVNEGVGRSGIHEGLQDHIRKGVRCPKRVVSEQDFERVMHLIVMVFTQGSLTQLGSCGVSRTAQSFFESELVDVDFSLISL